MYNLFCISILTCLTENIFSNSINLKMIKIISVCLLFLINFSIYIFTQFPTVAPYRDSGEMLCVIHTFGVAHSPGYPLYILLGKIFEILIPFGNTGYKINLLSGIFTSLCLVIIFLLILKIFTGNNDKKIFISAIFLTLGFGTSYLQWYLSLVSEMYTFNILIVSSIFYFIVSILFENKNIRYLYIVFFLFGLGLGNRLDLLLIGPGIFLFSYSFIKNRKNLFNIFLIFFIGFSVYLYLIIRSLQNPVFDWNHPANFDRLLSSLTRKTHGGTLDLLSKSYRSGENFLSGIFFYLKHLFNNFAYIGVIFGILSIIIIFFKNKILNIDKINLKKFKEFTVFLIVTFIFTGVLFIYLANMPPNPHALAILEAHFLLPNFVFFVCIVLGFYFVINIKNLNKYIYNLIIFLPVIFAGINFLNNFNDLNKRYNFFAYDYSKNILRSLQENSIVIIKEDVQLFSVWYQQFINKYKKNNIIIAEGLSGSEWYKNMLLRTYQDISLYPVSDSDYLEKFIYQNYKLRQKKIFFTIDTDLPTVKNYDIYPYGILNVFTEKKQEPLLKSDFIFDNIYVYRGRYDYYGYREFFTPDIIDDYSHSRHKTGYYYMLKNDFENALKNFKIALIYNKNFPLPAYHSAYIYFVKNDFKTAEDFSNLAIDLYRKNIDLAKKYNALSNVRNNINKELAEVYLQLGVIKEKLNKEQESLECYNKAIEYNNYLTKAYFNKAVVYWHKNDWNNVIRELSLALEIEPNYNEARYYLQQARMKLFQKQNEKK